MRKLNVSVFFFILLTGIIKTFALNGTASASTTNIATSDGSNEINRTVKRSFDFPTIFYPGPDNRFITMAPMPKLPVAILENTIINKNKLVDESHQHLLIDEPPTEITRPNINVQKVGFHAEQLNNWPAGEFIDPPTITHQRINVRRRPTHRRPVNIETESHRFTDNLSSHRQRANKFKNERFLPPPTTFRPINPFIYQHSNMLTNFSARSNLNQPRRKTFTQSKQKSSQSQPLKKVSNHNEFNVGRSQNRFHCPNIDQTGYFADVQSECQKFYICHNNRRFTFQCPTGTRFSQSHLVCDWERRVKCS